MMRYRLPAVMLGAFVAAGLAACGESSAPGDAASDSCDGCPPPASCRGTAVPCSNLRLASACGLQWGCSFDFVGLLCVGEAQTCSSIANAAGCPRHAGCAWTAEGDGGVSGCGGGGCSQLAGNESGCTSRADCVWDGTAAMCADGPSACACSGWPRGCSAYDDAVVCRDHVGCSWSAGADVGHCRGTPQPCSTHPSVDECLLAEGCSWH
jgi:hypothetical protein